MARRLFAVLAALVLVTRWCHQDLLWIEEAYPAAAALQLLHGAALYRDVWFDKPPVSAWLYVIWGAHAGWPLRLAGAAYVLLAAWLAWRFAREAWGEREGAWAATFTALFLTFGVPAAMMALAPDLLLVVPHLLAAWLAWRGQPLWAGVVAGFSMGIHTKGLFVLAAALLLSRTAPARILTGFVVGAVAVHLPLVIQGILPAYWEQVWVWGSRYSADTFVANPALEAPRRTANWAGFHAALVAGAMVFLARSRNRWRWVAWLALSLVGVTLGWRFFPRYYFQLLPPLTLMAARGTTLLGRRWALVAVLLLIPVARFGPRYVSLAAGQSQDWADVSLFEDSRAAASLIASARHPGDTLLVWGYRPDLFVLTRLPAGTRYLDSQPLTGVIADRHLSSAAATFPQLAQQQRRELVKTAPTWIADGLGLMNAHLAVTAYPDLREWLAGYKEAGRTRTYVLYRRGA